jgi:glycine betaine catabolism B
MNPVDQLPFQTEPTNRLASTTTWEAGTRVWSSGDKQKLKCCRCYNETHDIRTFEFRTEDALPVRFEPGQFMTISAVVGDQTVERCYTISSPPTRPYLVSITVKRVPGGKMSNWLHDNMYPGRELIAFGPSGAFTPVCGPAAKLLYLSAGSGVTPVMSMARAAYDLGEDADITFVHSARTPADIVFREELLRFVERLPNFRVHFICEGVGEDVEWTGDMGRLSLEFLERRVPDFRSREVFTCGPAGYMTAAKEILREAGHNPAKYHQESFDISAGVAVVNPSFEPVSERSKGSFTVTLSKSSRTFTMSSTETVLAAAKKAGIAIASSCSQGVCGTCKTKVLEGTVDMQHNGGIREREIQKGFRLLCCSRPTSDLVLER